jgi:hypothetical protein
MIPSTFDVLCGERSDALAHVGNKIFRMIISWYSDEYQNAQHREEKRRITKEIISLIQESGGNFLKMDENKNKWCVVGDEYAREKVSHALRVTKKNHAFSTQASDDLNSLFEVDFDVDK